MDLGKIGRWVGQADEELRQAGGAVEGESREVHRPGVVEGFGGKALDRLGVRVVELDGAAGVGVARRRHDLEGAPGDRRADRLRHDDRRRQHA